MERSFEASIVAGGRMADISEGKEEQVHSDCEQKSKSIIKGPSNGTIESPYRHT